MLKHHVRMFVLAVALAVPTAPAFAQCCGDCNGDGQVSIDELLKAVNRALNGCVDDGVGQHFPATGQTTRYVRDDDGAIEAGATLRYKDNGDATITDLNTGLMWEKKGEMDFAPDASNLHDADNCYSWAGECEVTGNACGTSADCPVPGSRCNATDCQSGTGTVFAFVYTLNQGNFAGHSDWRVPNVKELQSIVDYENNNPVVNAAFNTNCTPGCAATTCSCTRSGYYWSSTTYHLTPFTEAWIVDFGTGVAIPDNKMQHNGVRAVRGGL